MRSRAQMRGVDKPGETLAIRRIRIEKLFGHYSYDLKSETSSLDASRLLILYGDNGSGKTTILKIVFNLLSHIDKQGHKSYLARLPFRKVIIDLGARTQVIAVRRRKNLVGTYTAIVRRRERIAARITFYTDEENDVVSPPEPRARRIYERRVHHFLKTLGRLQLAFFFVTDDRKLLRNVPPQSRLEASPHMTVRGSRIIRPRPVSRGKYLDVALSQAIAIAVEWAREQVLSGSKQGEADANTIYANIVKNLATETAGAHKGERTNIRKLTETLQKQSERSEEFAKFGFPSALNATNLIKSLSGARKELATIYKIVEPFVDSSKAKLDALQEVQQSVSGLVETLNAFFKDKTVQFDLKTGVSVRAYDGNLLRPSDLSSGEKQLLLLFCNTLITRDEEAIYLIDEPEISLNIKWQRRLIASLLSLTQKRRVQFILATHSFELIAPHQRNVLSLSDIKNATSPISAASKSSRVVSHTQT